MSRLDSRYIKIYITAIQNLKDIQNTLYKGKKFVNLVLKHMSLELLRNHMLYDKCIVLPNARQDNDNSVVNIFPNPMISQMRNVRCLGRGGFGSVQLVRSQLDDRLIALKRISFRSKIPPWEIFDIDTLDESDQEMYTKLLREIKALSACQNCPQVIKYYASWIEPDYKAIKLGQSKQSNDRVFRQLEDGVSERRTEEGEEEDGDSSTSRYSSFSGSDQKQWPYILNVSMEPIIGLTLYDWIRVKNANLGKPSFGVIENIIFTQIVMGIRHIHGNGVLHRDIKPTNIMITISGHEDMKDVKEILVKILDFGLAYIERNVHQNENDWKEKEKETPNSFVETDTLDIGTYAYIAPELYDDNKKKYIYGKEVDVYSLGIILLEMCYPFNTEMERYEEIQKIRVTRKASLELWEYVPEQAKLIEKLITYPNDRPTINETLDIISSW